MVACRVKVPREQPQAADLRFLLFFKSMTPRPQWSPSQTWNLATEGGGEACRPDRNSPPLPCLLKLGMMPAPPCPYGFLTSPFISPFLFPFSLPPSLFSCLFLLLLLSLIPLCSPSSFFTSIFSHFPVLLCPFPSTINPHKPRTSPRGPSNAF